MYVVTIKRYGLHWHTTVFDKSWSEEMMSNQISILEQKKFFFRASARRWLKSFVMKELVRLHKLEIVDG